MKPLNLSATFVALKEFDATAAQRDADWDAALEAEDANAALAACVRADARAWHAVKLAFAEDTQDRNSVNVAMYVTPDFVRRLLDKYPPN